MMVEAGGTEGSFEKYADGAPKVSEEVLSAGLEASKLWIRESINLQRELVRDFVAARGAITPMEYQTIADYQDDVYESVESDGRHVALRGQQAHDQGRAQRGARRRDRVDHRAPEGRVPEPR